MANYSELIQTINDSIKANGKQEITGPVLNSVLNAMVSALGEGYQFMGVATPGTNPGTPDGKVFYIALRGGNYSNFGIECSPYNIYIIRRTSVGWAADALNIAKLEIAFKNACENYSKKGEFLIDYGHLVSIDNTIAIYYASDDWDLLWIKILRGSKTLTIKGVNATRLNIFKDYISHENLLFSTKDVTEPVSIPEGAEFACITCRKTDNPDGYKYPNAYVLQEGMDAKIAESNLQNLPQGRGLFDPENFLYGYALSEGAQVTNRKGILSNKLYLKAGGIYKVSGIPSYGIHPVLYIARYNDNDEFIDRYTSSDLNNTDGYLSGTFIALPNGAASYYRINLQINTSADLIVDNLMLIEGAEEQVYAEEKATNFNGLLKITPNPCRKIRILSIGNSYSLNYLAYVPFVMRNLYEPIDIEIGVLYLSGATLEMHWNNIESNAKSYIYYKYSNRKIAWDDGISNVSIKQALEDNVWDIIMLQQGSTSSWLIDTYQPYLNNIIKYIYNNFNYRVKFGWFEIMSRPATSSQEWSEEEIAQHFTSIAQNAETVLNDTLCDFVIPIGAAIQNARGTSLNNLGDYTRHMLCSSDGGHLQSGLPCQLAAYVSALSYFKLLGIDEIGIIGDNLLLTAGNLMLKNAPQTNGTSTGATKANMMIAQVCALMAIKYPFEVTDVSDLI